MLFSKKFIITFISLALLVAPGSPFAKESADDDKREMLRTIDSIKQLLELQYAPCGWKKWWNHWDLDQETIQIKNWITTSEKLSICEFQNGVRKFLNSASDYHLKACFASSEKASLPFCIKGIGKRYFITAINDPNIGLKIGDELLLFDGEAIHDVIQRLIEKEFGKGTPATDRALAEILFTERVGAQGVAVPNGSVRVTVQSVATNKLETHTCFWRKRAETVESKPHPNTLGSRDSFLPYLGETITWCTDLTHFFHAYIYVHESGRKVGVIRIPHYLYSAHEVQQFSEILVRMEKETEALVIDQLNNTGGSLFSLYAIASMLSEVPLETPQHRFIMTWDDALYSLSKIKKLQTVESDEQAQEVLGSTYEGYPITKHVASQLLQHHQFLLDQWYQGHQLTDPTSVWGIDQLPPDHRVTYTKPILILINELNFSGGEVFPAIMQDNHRARLFGTKTAGSCGFIRKISFPNSFGIEEITITNSFGERQDHTPIENLGVMPDILYEVTEEDVRLGYRGYIKAVNAVLR